ncbi:hypothetical protein DPSP01_010126 [Paraphaeosphaeria sporulosa]
MHTRKEGRTCCFAGMEGYPPQYVDGVQLRPIYYSLEESSDHILHQLIELNDEPAQFHNIIRACMEPAPKTAKALWEKGHFVLSTPLSTHPDPTHCRPSFTKPMCRDRVLHALQDRRNLQCLLSRKQHTSLST